MYIYISYVEHKAFFEYISTNQVKKQCRAQSCLNYPFRASLNSEHNPTLSN